ncbi:hypothetical protein SPRG_20085 [Saprolegnia parasitica CBS 223.65]|uniref:Uncharacterized protein n=1 Tax=Saprolegnia parasitica (strain CBS 223.65) TaxID=695850 RepID=A0A067CQ85_SAPPC|nr:hypothetical protein SPRG_20085 [Saprolegnia parasitica CBS 223.65]KDO28982.1 hypothetical protein SPRG_20085 [Saprolegnia parasitica CBS 223.65]|eukprot:XP_012200315.1 hypothetical protein SPRG_20085 [Saprolegnia parasitica CBS 223.65]
MDPLWSQVGVVIPAILQVVTTAMETLDAAALDVFDAAVGLNLCNFVMSLTGRFNNFELLYEEILGHNMSTSRRTTFTFNAVSWSTPSRTSTTTLSVAIAIDLTNQSTTFSL